MTLYIPLIHALIRQIYETASRIPVIRLSLYERKVLTGLVGADAGILVILTARAICQHPVQLAHLADLGQGLLLRQRFADALHKLEQALADVRQIIADTHLVMQAHALADARRVLRQIDEEALLPMGPPPGHDERRIALLSPLLFLQERRERLRGRLKGLLQRSIPAPVRSDVRSGAAEDLLRRLLGTPGAWGLCPERTRR